MKGEPDDDTQQVPDPSTAALGGEEQQEIGEDEKPGATDLLKAAKDAVKNLKKQEPAS